MSLEVRGHEEVKRVLRSLDAASLLFVGPSSVGRRRVAGWYAAWRNCAQPGQEPCGRCESCRAAARGDHPDLLVKAPARTTTSGRANMRPEITIDRLVPRPGPHADPEPLSRWLETRPRYARRVGVVDGADAVNRSAGNAFLKLLEEPPSWATVILIAPSPGAVLPTLASRCTPVRFGAAPVDGFEDLAPHPALRTGQVGALLRAREDPTAHRDLQAAAEAWVEALDGELDGALAAAANLGEAAAARGDALAGDLLRELLRARTPRLYPVALDALDEAEAALAAYARPATVWALLTLRLRAALNAPRVGVPLRRRAGR